MERVLQVLLLAGFILCCTSSVQLDERPPKIYFMHIDSKIRFRFATTVVTSKVVNPARHAQEAVFRCTLPNEAYITNFTLLLDNQTIVGVVKEKHAAERQYQDAVERGESAAHITTKHRETNKFDIQVNIAAAAKVVFHLTYQELLKRKEGVYNHVIVVDPGQIVDDFQIRIDLKESRDITLLRVPPLHNDLLTDIDITATNALAVIERPNPRSASILYTPSAVDQGRQSEEGLNGKFVMHYDVDREMDYGDILVVDGYFVHFFAPEGNNLTSLPKDVLFILDKSGSMSGRKMNQLSEAMLNILDDLQPQDRFSIMTFDSSVNKPWQKSAEEFFTPATVYYVDQASLLVKQIRANGGTNIDGALKEGVSVIGARLDTSRTPVIVFLTDGQPTVGLRNTKQILQNVKNLNELKISIFTLAFGTGADFKFTRKLAIQNDGFGRKIYADSDADLQISGFYREISTVLLKNVRFQYIGNSVNQSSLTDTTLPIYFEGSEYVIAGRLREGATNEVPTVSVSATGSTGNIVIAVPGLQLDTSTLTSYITDDIDFRQITEHVWAYLTVKQYWMEMETTDDESEKQRWKTKLLTLALKYQFVTPLTSMVVTLPNREPVICDLSALYSASQHDSPTMNSGPGGALISGIQQHLMKRTRPSASFLDPNIMPTQLYDLQRRYGRKKTHPQIMHSQLQRRYGRKKTPIRGMSNVRFSGKRGKARRHKAKKSNRRGKKRTSKRIPAVAIRLPGSSEPLCFNIRNTNGNFEDLLTDATQGFRITAMAAPVRKLSRRRRKHIKKHVQPYISEVKINSTDLPEIHYFQDQITSGNQTMRYVDNPNVHYGFNGINISLHLMNKPSSDLLQLHASFPVGSSQTLGGMLGPFANIDIARSYRKGKKTMFVARRQPSSSMSFKIPTVLSKLSENFMGEAGGNKNCWYVLKKTALGLP